MLTEESHSKLDKLLKLQEEQSLYCQKFLSVDGFTKRYHKKKGQVYIDLSRGLIPGAFKDGKSWLINAEVYEEHLTKLSIKAEIEFANKNAEIKKRINNKMKTFLK